MLLYWACLLLMFSDIVWSHLGGDEQHYWENYLNHKEQYTQFFTEMMHKKNEEYHSKKDEYSNQMVQYKEVEREHQQDHRESDDEQVGW